MLQNPSSEASREAVQRELALTQKVGILSMPPLICDLRHSILAAGAGLQWTSKQHCAHESYPACITLAPSWLCVSGCEAASQYPSMCVIAKHC